MAAVKMQIVYHDLADYGLPLVTPDQPEFVDLVADILSRPRRFGNCPPEEIPTAAVLLNRSGKTIVTLSFLWRFTNGEGHTPTWRFSNLGSGTQFDVLSGRTGVVRGQESLILPGSKRLLTERGMYGDNRDVLSPEEVPRGGGFLGGSSGSRGNGAPLSPTELQLDIVIFEEGSYAGPDEWGMIAGLTEEVPQERALAEKILTVLRGGASPGQVFEMLRPLARMERVPSPPGIRGGYHRPLLKGFVHQAMHQLTYGSEGQLEDWLTQVTDSTPLALRKATPLA